MTEAQANRNERGSVRSVLGQHDRVMSSNRSIIEGTDHAVDRYEEIAEADARPRVGAGGGMGFL